MKENEFISEANKIGRDLVLSIPICYSLDDEGNVILDSEGMIEALEFKIGDIEEILK
ncbi:MAG: hypothetical protein WC781_05690 [Candidatus Pacearchaeota archaeon]|jgi:hypothetical protein